MDDKKEKKHVEDKMRKFKRLLDRSLGPLDSMSSLELEEKEKEIVQRTAELEVEADVYAAKMSEITRKKQEIERSLHANKLEMRMLYSQICVTLINKDLNHIAQCMYREWPGNPTYTGIVVEFYRQFKDGELGFVELIRTLIQGFDKQMNLEGVYNDDEIIRQCLYSAQMERVAYYYELARKGSDGIELDELESNLEDSWPTSAEHRKKVLKLFKQFKNGKVTQSSLQTKLFNALEKECRGELDALASHTSGKTENGPKS